MSDLVRLLRSHVYRRGYRPKAGSIFFSPSLALAYGFKDVDWHQVLGHSVADVDATALKQAGLLSAAQLAKALDLSRKRVYELRDGTR